MKLSVVVLLSLLGAYWLFAHTAPYPFNHEQLGLYYHTTHRVFGVLFLIAAGYLALKRKK